MDEGSEPETGALRHQGRQRDQHDEAEIDERVAERESEAGQDARLPRAAQ